MPFERYVLLGLAQVRSAWFREVARWATSAVLPIEFVKAMSVEEVRVRLRSGRAYSALLIDDSFTAIDRDLVSQALDAGCAVVVVDSGRTGRTWADLGISGALSPQFTPADLAQVLGQVATPIASAAEAEIALGPAGPVSTGFRGDMVAVTGSGGTGRSTVAMAVAQGLARDPRQSGLVCLADLALDADLALLHGTDDVVPGVTELVDAHRGGQPNIEAVRSLTWQCDERGYHLLLGLRRHRDWTGLRQRSFEAALDGLRRGFRTVVADVDADLEGERATGSLDVEERNLIARTAVSAADLVVAVGSPDMKGVHSLLRVARHLLDHGVPPERLLPVFNRSPKGPRARSELTAAFGQLLRDSAGAVEVASALHLPTRRNLDLLLRDGARLPDPWLMPLAGSVRSVLDRHSPRPSLPTAAPEPVRVAPGSLGSWTADDLGDPEGGLG